MERWSYRIGCSVSLDVRLFDEKENLMPMAPTKAPADREYGLPTFSERAGDETREDWRIWTIGPSSTGASPVAESEDDDASRTWAVKGSTTDAHVMRVDLLPRRVRWRNNPHRVADELEIELHLDQLPFPPDGSVARSILVEMRRGVISADDWANAMMGKVASDGLPLNVPLMHAGDEPDFVGFVDVHKLKLSSASASIVTLPCRDMAGVFADTQVHGRTIESDIPVDEAIARFLSTFGFAQGMRVIWVGSETPPILGAFMPKAKRPKASKKGIPKPQKNEKTSALDAIADYCTHAAVMPTWRGYDLFLGPAATLDQATAAQVPRLVLGVNLEDLELEHKMSANQTRPVEVHSFDPDSGLMAIARWPVDSGSGTPSTLWVPPGASGAEEKPPLVHTVYGVTNVQHLTEIAKNIYDEMARQELSGKTATRDIATIEGRAKGIADLLALRAGDPIAIHIAPSVEESAGSYLQRLATGWRESVASRVVDRIVSADRLLVYRVRELDWRWGIDTPSELEIVFINMLDVEERKRGGARIRAAARGAGFKELWSAIDQDMLDGEITPAHAAKLHAMLVEREKTAKAAATPSISTPKPSAGGAPKWKPPTSSALSPKPGGAWGGLGSLKF